MNLIKKLPWYDSYKYLLEQQESVEKQIVDLGKPEEKLQRIKTVYQFLGADYSKNSLISEKETDIKSLNGEEYSELNRLKKVAQLIEAVKLAVSNPSEESRVALSAYRDDEVYSNLVKQLIFYISVARAKEEREFIGKAYIVLITKYSPKNVEVFQDEGVYYYMFYLQCLREWVDRCREKTEYHYIKRSVDEQCKSLWRELKQYIDDEVIGNQIKQIRDEIILIREF